MMVPLKTAAACCRVPRKCADVIHDANVMPIWHLGIEMASLWPVAETFREIRHVLRPGGELRFYEHQRSNRWPVALLSGLVTPIWSRAAGGCHPTRDILAETEQAGFGVESLDRFALRGFDHVVGVARPR
ncbi:hypothetical protein ACQP2T_34395 [Nonomuraea sp. CA-143628]|uniref:hypothetical protein n=1 Tax=Nonomuraea sp. CA-143628 TaxID=3239997 RepID=UPI003D8F39CE